MDTDFSTAVGPFTEVNMTPGARRGAEFCTRARLGVIS